MTTPTQLKSQIKSIESLEKSKGWKLIEEVMREELISAALMLAENRKLTTDEINFRRGAMWAAKQLLDVPTKLKLKLSSELSLTIDPAKAGKEINHESTEPTGVRLHH